MVVTFSVAHKFIHHTPVSLMGYIESVLKWLALHLPYCAHVRHLWERKSLLSTFPISWPDVLSVLERAVHGCATVASDSAC